jgi:prepilin-type N-terminal cleavage/methylation domain-containing protein/prepilin-type processing-associated H-X9-DG protein
MVRRCSGGNLAQGKMKSFRSIAGNGEKECAFTLIELLVVVAVIALLILIRIPAMARATNQNKRAQCSSNLRQFTLAMQIYACENEDRLPTYVGYWAWDASADTGTFVESTGSKWTVMYCPGTAPGFSEQDNSTLYNYAPPYYRVLGYANTFPGNTSLLPSEINPTLTPHSIILAFGVQVVPAASQRVLLADASVSRPGQNLSSVRYTYNYTSIQSGYPKPQFSSHLTGPYPGGGNVGMVDGHVEWRKFDDMSPRSNAFSTSPVFWW